jgi:hypothetical protein
MTTEALRLWPVNNANEPLQPGCQTHNSRRVALKSSRKQRLLLSLHKRSTLSGTEGLISLISISPSQSGGAGDLARVSAEAYQCHLVPYCSRQSWPTLSSFRRETISVCRAFPTCELCTHTTALNLGCRIDKLLSRSLRSQPHAIDPCYPPKPVLVQVDFPFHLRDRVRRSVKQSVAELAVVMPGMIGDPVGANRMSK